MAIAEMPKVCALYLVTRIERAQAQEEASISMWKSVSHSGRCIPSGGTVKAMQTAQLQKEGIPVPALQSTSALEKVLQYC